ncbi:MAG: hypothetical protein Ta2G_12160 [Termitinemataceae bacterium]|nr:MAG: hypothetical protein Ta2G_12160 [Termitinemataceae bacterium]
MAVFSVSCATNKGAEKAKKTDMADRAMRMDPGLVKMVLPSVIRSNQAKFKKHPTDQKLAIAAGSYNVMYANAFIQGPASILPKSDYQKRDAQYKKAKKYYAQGVKILTAGLENKYSGITAADNAELAKNYLSKITKEDVPMIYWLTAGTLCAFSIDPFDLQYGSKISHLSALIKKAYELDPNFNTSSLDEFFFMYYSALPPELGGDIKQAPIYYERALKKTKGQSVGLFVSWIEYVSIPNQNYKDFKEKIAAALAIDIEANPDIKLTNTLSMRKAKYYSENADLFFLDTE